MDQTINVEEVFSLLYSNDLEKYRAESLRSKEPETIAWIEDFKKDEVFYDIGANIGIYSLYAHGKRGVKVFAFEPFLGNYKRLTENIAANDFKDIHALNMALDSEYSLTRFYSFDTRISASGGQIHHPTNELGKEFEAINTHDVLAISLDKFISDFKIETPHHIKIDVDGREPQIIRGMLKTLQAPRTKSLLVEFDANLPETENIISEITSHGFSTDNKYNKLENHSRNRRKNKTDNVVENIIFTR